MHGASSRRWLAVGAALDRKAEGLAGDPWANKLEVWADEHTHSSLWRSERRTRRLAGRTPVAGLPGRAPTRIPHPQIAASHLSAMPSWSRCGRLSDPRSAGAAFRAVLSKMRTALGHDALIGRERIQLVLPPDAWVDVEAAEEALHRAEAAIFAGEWGEAWGAARVAAFLPERGFLLGHDVAWVDEHRRELEHVTERAERCIAACGLALGGSELVAAERASRMLVERRPLDESAVALYMEVLAALGDPSAALSEYEGLRRRLRDELGISPGRDIRVLHQRLLSTA